MGSYFSNFPVVLTPAGPAKDITARVVLKTSSDQRQFNSVPITPGERADITSSKYYDDPFGDWLVYLANNIIDPLSESYLTDDQLNDQIADQYGSVEIAAQKISHWISNWKQDQSVLSPSQYSNLPTKVRQLYDFVLDYTGAISGYERKHVDVFKVTNQIVTYTVAAVPPLIIIDDLVIVTLNGISIGQGQIISLTSTSITIQHVLDYYNGDSLTINNINVPVISFTQYDSISPDEVPYFSSVSYYQKETDENQSRSTISLVSNQYYSQLKQQLKDLLTSD